MDKTEVLDINSEQEVLSESDNLIRGLDSGLHALALDFGYHVKSTFLNDKIFDLRNNISYRLSSSRFHFHLLFKELKLIQQKHDALDYTSDITSSPNWHIEIDKRHLSYILDSVIFHLSSVFDYTAILVNYILSKTDNTPNWNSIENSARGNSNIFAHDNTNEIKDVVKLVHNNFVRHLYDYRSELIHRTSDLIKGSYAWEVISDKKTLLFLCSKTQRKSFKNLSDKDVQITVSYFTQYLILQTIESTAKIIKAIRSYMENNSKSQELIFHNKLILAYIDETTKEMKSPGLIYWKPFDAVFRT